MLQDETAVHGWDFRGVMVVRYVRYCHIAELICSAEILILFREYSRGLLLLWGGLHVKKVERLVKLIVSYTCPLTANAQRWPL